jgi:hypothetical protein
MTAPLIPVKTAPVSKSELEVNKIYDVYVIGDFEGRGRFVGYQRADEYCFQDFVHPSGEEDYRYETCILSYNITFRPVPVSAAVSKKRMRNSNMNEEGQARQGQRRKGNNTQNNGMMNEEEWNGGRRRFKKQTLKRLYKKKSSTHRKRTRKNRNY